MPNLFDPITIGELKLSNRIMMAPLTRCRAGADRVPNALMEKYYTQRSNAGMIISEATSVNPMGVGYANTPGIWSDEQVAGWKKITDAVHKNGGTIFLQLWHVGRISDPIFLSGHLPVAPSAIAAEGHISLVRPMKHYVVPRALDRNEIPQVIEAFKKGAQNAQKAGFDGVEIHGANGYLLDQFLQDGTNKREDDYGGSVENRARLMLEITDAAISVWGNGRVGMHLAPRSDSHSISDSNHFETFGYVARELGKKKIAFLCVRESLGENQLGAILKSQFGGTYIANEKFNFESANNAIKNNQADAVAFGKLFIANPDLPKRFLLKSTLNQPQPETFYGGGEEGYTTYPSL
ncbi:MAG: alkene reductase [Pseudomonadota bacterium]